MTSFLASILILVQIAANKDEWAWLTDLLKATLPAAATAGVAWLAMNKSHRQFELTSARQSAEFSQSIGQQARALKIQTQIATEVELKKEYCRNVRDACSQFLSHALEANQHNITYKTACDFLNNGGFGYEGERDNAHRQFMNALHKMSSSKLMLMSYLDPKVEKHFYASIINVDQLLQNGGDDFGKARGSASGG
ncbi:MULTISPECIES: hypothetical protein [unclassified Enterobacter]|uniref:hypothetical protein n=1 Tax=unclassified Enterobacter TaxID=2608935 RepID=UPI00292C9EDD|nr:hypothetical protein [Enterobacter sp. 23-M-SZ-13]MDV0597257.1 hypothetical protein [Enterobacter sp. 23-M-SZ-13]